MSTPTTQPHPNDRIAIQVGDIAPDFSLVDTEGQTHNLHHTAVQQPLIIVFYRGDWCPYCQLQLYQLGQVYQQILDHGAMIWAISPQDRATNHAFREKREVGFPILCDESLTVINQWGLRDELDPHAASQIPWPTTYIIDTAGRVHWRKMGYNKADRPTPGEIIAALP